MAKANESTILTRLKRDVEDLLAREDVERARTEHVNAVIKERDMLRSELEATVRHNALLLEEREASKPKEPIPDTPHWIWREGQGYVLEKSGLTYEPPYQACADNYEPERSPTHWQRFKSFLKHWYVELLCVMVILCVLAGLVGLSYWSR